MFSFEYELLICHHVAFSFTIVLPKTHIVIENTQHVAVNNSTLTYNKTYGVRITYDIINTDWDL